MHYNYNFLIWIDLLYLYWDSRSANKDWEIINKKLKHMYDQLQKLQRFGMDIH